jgi:hypothetical protein
VAFGFARAAPHAFDGTDSERIAKALLPHLATGAHGLGFRELPLSQTRLGDRKEQLGIGGLACAE